jgi:hypothetical protein
MEPRMPSVLTHDLLGRAVTETELQLLHVYDILKHLAASDDLSPCAHQNVRKALACLWQVTNDLNLQYEQLYDLGV